MHSIEQMISSSISPYLFGHSLTTSILEQKSINIMYRYLETVFFFICTYVSQKLWNSGETLKSPAIK